MRRIYLAIGLAVFACTPALAADLEPFQEAGRNGVLAREALLRSRNYVDGWLNHADPTTGLIPRNLMRNKDIWNAKDCAADNYPFMVLTAAITDEALFNGHMLDMLHTETRLTSRIDRLPDTYSFTKQGWEDEKLDINAIMFGSSEYIKDGLMPLTEWLGPSPWADRMIGIMDDIWKHAPIDSRFGKIPSTNLEVNGEMLQSLSRLYWMTGRKEYLDYAFRIGDYYLFDHLPTRQKGAMRLRDHSCEIISGLSELYLAASIAAPEKKKAYHDPIHEMYDRLLAIGPNEYGLLYNFVDLETGQPTDKSMSDGWGYIYDGFYTVYLVDGTKAYRDIVVKALSNLNEHARAYAWEAPYRGSIGSADGYADSIEGAINLYNREPVPSAAEWIDSQIQLMLGLQEADGVIEGWHGDGNYARTAIMYALWKTQGTTIRPWRSDVRFGACQRDGVLYVSVVARTAWQGVLRLDKPRHKVNLHLPMDYPRINQFPEWFTAQADRKYKVTVDDQESVHTGQQLIDGLTIAVDDKKLETLIRIALVP